MKALGLIIAPTRTSGKMPMSPNNDEWLKGRSGEWQPASGWKVRERLRVRQITRDSAQITSCATAPCNRTNTCRVRPTTMRDRCGATNS